MLHVLARSMADFEKWRICIDLPSRVVRPITTPEQVRGLDITYSDIVRLDGFSFNPRLDEITDALVPLEIAPSKVAAVGDFGVTR